MSMKGEIIWRIGLIYVLMTLIAGAIIFKTLHVQMWEGEKWRKKSVAVRIKDFEVAPNRGDICACDGRKLASSVLIMSCVGMLRSWIAIFSGKRSIVWLCVYPDFLGMKAKLLTKNVWKWPGPGRKHIIC